MSARVPACQLLERQQDNYAALWVIDPPMDSWLVDQSAGVVSGNQGAPTSGPPKASKPTTLLK